MAHSGSIAAIVVAVIALAFKAQADYMWNLPSVFMDIREKLNQTLSLEDQADGEKVLSVAKEHISHLVGDDGRASKKLLDAWHRVLHEPDKCDASSLEYVATLHDCVLNPYLSQSTRTLAEATQVYARKCLTSNYIANKIYPQGSGCFWTRGSKSKVKFLDHQFMIDYFSEHPEQRRFMTVVGLDASRALVKAIIRDRKIKTLDLQREAQLHTYLKKRLFKPCSKYYKAKEPVMSQIFSACFFLEGGYEGLISTFNNSTLEAICSYELCWNIEATRQEHLVEIYVFSNLHTLAAEMDEVEDEHFDSIIGLGGGS